MVFQNSTFINLEEYLFYIYICIYVIYYTSRTFVYIFIRMYTHYNIQIGYIVILGPNSVSEFNVYNCLGILYKVKNDFEKSHEMYNLALKGRQEVLGT
jgi:hypothetical protein